MPMRGRQSGSTSPCPAEGRAHTRVSPPGMVLCRAEPRQLAADGQGLGNPESSGAACVGGRRGGLLGGGEALSSPSHANTLPESSEHRQLPGEPVALVLCKGMWLQEVLVGSSSDGVWKPSAFPPLRGTQLVPSRCLVSCPETSQ